MRGGAVAASTTVDRIAFTDADQARSGGSSDLTATLTPPPTTGHQSVPRIYIVNADGTGQRAIVSGTSAQSLAWSPDGSRLAFVDLVDASGTSGRVHLEVVNGDGTRRHDISGDYTAVTEDASPAWAPDGKRVAYLAGHESGLDVWIAQADGSGNRNVLGRDAHGSFDAGPTWSPDGDLLAVAERFGGDACPRGNPTSPSCPGPSSALKVFVPGTGARTIASRPASTSTPIKLLSGAAWSPDGGRLAFTDGAGLWTVGRDGSRAHD